jgi:hypothetical protein
MGVGVSLRVRESEKRRERTERHGLESGMIRPGPDELPEVCEARVDDHCSLAGQAASFVRNVVRNRAFLVLLEHLGLRSDATRRL